MEKTTAIIVAIFASSGLWQLLMFLLQRHDGKKDCENSEMQKQSEMLKGLGHDRICYLGETYIARGYITKSEYDNLKNYLYQPYRNIGGNGTAERIMEEVEKLPLRKEN